MFLALSATAVLLRNPAATIGRYIPPRHCRRGSHSALASRLPVSKMSVPIERARRRRRHPVSAIAAIATIASANASAIDFLGTPRLFAARGALMAGGGL